MSSPAKKEIGKAHPVVRTRYGKVRLRVQNENHVLIDNERLEGTYLELHERKINAHGFVTRASAKHPWLGSQETLDITSTNPKSGDSYYYKERGRIFQTVSQELVRVVELWARKTPEAFIASWLATVEEEIREGEAKEIATFASLSETQNQLRELRKVRQRLQPPP